MVAPLETIVVASIYNGPLPKRMAKCTPDMLSAIRDISNELASRGTKFVLSDLFRSYDMQLQANLDYVTKKKKAFSPPPGGSLHEAGRAFDMDLSELKKINLADFWQIAAKYGVVPIIDTPSAGKSESWHFECRGSHKLVYDYYAANKGDNFEKPYKAMAASAIVSIGQKVDGLGDDPLPSFIQSALIRLGHEIGDMDGRIGPGTRAGLEAANIDPKSPIGDIASELDHLLQEKFPAEYFIAGAAPANA